MSTGVKSVMAYEGYTADELREIGFTMIERSREFESRGKIEYSLKTFTIGRNMIEESRERDKKPDFSERETLFEMTD